MKPEDPGTAPARLGRRRGFLCFSLFYWTAFLLFAEPNLVGEGVHHHLFFPAIFADGNLNLADEFTAYPQGSPLAMRFETLPSGYAANPYPFGASLLQLPFLLIAWQVDRVWGAFSETGLYDFLALPYLFAQILSTWFYVWIGCFLIWRTLEDLFGFDEGLSILTALVLATPMLNHLVHAPAHSHAAGFFALALFYRIWFRIPVRRSPVHGLTIGAAAALVVLIRWQDLLFLLPAATVWAGSLFQRLGSDGEKRDIGRELLFGLGWVAAFAVWVSPQWVYWSLLYERFPPPIFGVAPEGSPAYLDLLFSKRSGLLRQHPLALLVMAGLGWWAWKDPKRAVFPVALILQFLLIAPIAADLGADSFGQQMWVSGLPIGAFGLAALFSIRWRPWTGLLRLVLLMLCVWNIVVFRMWQGGFLEGGRYSTSRAFEMFWTAPERLFGSILDAAYFPQLIGASAFGALVASLSALVVALLAGWLIVRFEGRDSVGGAAAAGVVLLAIPLGLVAAFLQLDRRAGEALQIDLSLSAVYPTDLAPLVRVRVGPGEIFAGEVDALLLAPGRSLRIDFQNPQPVGSAAFLAYLSSAAPEISRGDECLRITIVGEESRRSKVFRVGEELDFPDPELGAPSLQGGTLDPRTVERGSEGVFYFSYGLRFEFDPLVATGLVLENLLPGGEIGIEAASLTPAEIALGSVYREPGIMDYCFALEGERPGEARIMRMRQFPEKSGPFVDVEVGRDACASAPCALVAAVAVP